MRADVYLASHGFAQSRERAKKMIEQGRVSVNGAVIDKSSKNICDEDFISVSPPEEYEFVSRGGLKLEYALEYFNISVEGLTAADLGASSGGFCDCLLKHGIKKIYAVDCGSGQLDPKIKNDKRVISMENTNARYIDESLFGEKVDFVVMDLSFISQILVFPAISRILKNGGVLVSLIKPQFEAGRTNIGKKGIVKDKKARDAAVQNVLKNAELFGLYPRCQGPVESPIKGGDGNTEFLCAFDFPQNSR